MPAKSKSQQRAAGIALSVKRGDTSENELRGASKSMADMGTTDLEKFASTRHKGLPSHVEEGFERKLDEAFGLTKSTVVSWTCGKCSRRNNGKTKRCNTHRCNGRRPTA